MPLQCKTQWSNGKMGSQEVYCIREGVLIYTKQNVKVTPGSQRRKRLMGAVNDPRKGFTRDTS